MKTFGSILRAALFASLLLVGGCIYTRLLSFKNQLADFDRFVEVREAGGVTFVFREPILETNDVLAVTGLAPSSIEAVDGEETWTYAYVNQVGGSPTGGVAASDVSFTMRLRDGKLREMTCPARISAVLGRGFMVAAARSLGKARINQRTYTLGWDLERDGGYGGPVPTRQSIAALLGQEWIRIDVETETTLVYVYRLRSMAVSPGPQSGEVRARFDFGRQDGILRRAIISLGKARLILSVPSKGAAVAQ